MYQKQLMVGTLFALLFTGLAYHTGAARLVVGGGLKVQQGVPYALVTLQSGDKAMELSWGHTAHRLRGLNTDINASTTVFGALLGWHPALAANVIPFVAVGGISTQTRVLGTFKGQHVNAVLPQKGVQAAAGLAYRYTQIPLGFFFDLSYSTLTQASLLIDVGTRIDTLTLPLSDVVGVRWSLGFALSLG